MIRSSSSHLLSMLQLAAAGALWLCLSQPAQAMEPPTPGMLERMRAQGTLPQALEFAGKLGNNQLKPALRGRAQPELAPDSLAEQIMRHYGASLDAQGARAVSAATARELDWVELDLNHDRVVDERDILALGFARPKGAAAFPSLGTSKTFCLLLDFADYPAYFAQSEVQSNLFGAGTDAYYYKSLQYYYDQASYGQLNIDGMAYGWHRASQLRTYYHPDDSQDYPESWTRQAELVEEAILAYDALGEDFSQYDNDGDGNVDYFLVVYSGPVGDWASFWWGYFGVGLPGDFVVDGVRFPAYSWQWERYYGFHATPPEPEHWDPLVTIHETGHALGLPDYYDYDGAVGPPGGVGGLDMMDGNWGDHNCFSKYVLGWFTPTVAFYNLNDEPLEPSHAVGDAVIVMPGFDPVSPWSEYFFAQNRFQGGIDASYPASGILIWHVDARVNSYGNYTYDNSYTEHKLLKLLEADGLNEIENWGGADAEDFYQTGLELSPGSNPSSNRYNGADSLVTVNDFSAPGAPMTADFIMYSSNPPQVQILSPGAGDTVSGDTGIHIVASDDIAVDKVQILVDGLLVATNTSETDFTYNWNTLVDFNKTLTITARAWDEEDQAGSMSIQVTVSNTGVTEIADDFAGGLAQWRSINEALASRGQVTRWATRDSPGEPPPLGGGREAWVRPVSDDVWCGAHDRLRAMRLDTSAFTRQVQVRFAYRCRPGFALWATQDEGLHWVRLDTIPESNGWSWFNRLYALAPGAWYLRLDYDGETHSADNGGWSANIDDVLVSQIPSEPPTIDITSHDTGDTVSGIVLFTAEAQDDTGVAQVRWYLNDALAATDSDGAPWEYSRDTTGDDNLPAVRLKAIAEDVDGLPSVPDEITVSWRNERAYPVADDLEGGYGNWGFQNDGLEPQWNYVSNESHSPNNCMGFIVAEGGSWQPSNYDGLWYSGYPPAGGRQCIDLSHADIHNPELTFYYKADQPGDGGISLYFYNTWYGWQDFGWLAGDQAEWTELTFPLDRFIGQSGQLVWWVWGGSQTDGAGMWIDDVRVGNRRPVLETLDPPAGRAGSLLVLSGRKFGAARAASSVTFHSGVTAAPEDYVTWSDTFIRLHVPLGAGSGPVYVTVDDEPSNGLPYDVSVLYVDLQGIDPLTIYDGHRLPQLEVLTNADTQRVELVVDGVVHGVSTTRPFTDLQFPLARLKNGVHTAQLLAQRGIEHAQSTSHACTVYSLRGDIDADGQVGLSDVAALEALIGMTSGDAEFRPWFDPDGDGSVTEADTSYIGYHLGDAINAW